MTSRADRPTRATSPPRPPSPLRHLAWLRALVLMVVVSVLAGLVVAAIALPVVAGLGAAAKTGAADWASLPTSLQQSPAAGPQQDPRRRTARCSASSTTRTACPATFAQIPTVTKQALLAVEDARFYAHNGVDIQGSLRALVSNLHGDSLQGGSTLTQQYVKNMLSSTRPTQPRSRRPRSPRSSARSARPATR